MPKRIEQHDARELASGYTKTHRIYEFIGIGVSVVIASWLAVRLAASPALTGWFVPLAAFVGMLFADFLSGFVHWLFDTWWSPTTPIVGQLAVRTFREHHVDQKAITRHDFVETNGHNIALAMVPSGAGLCFLDLDDAWSVLVGMSLFASTVFISITSQIHKWAHMDLAPAPIRVLQKLHVFISPDHHAKHHDAPYDRGYCITTGWLNGPLRAVGFFVALERIVTALTGAIPRKDDVGEAMAIEILESRESPPSSSEASTSRGPSA